MFDGSIICVVLPSAASVLYRAPIGVETHPEVNVEIAASTKFPVAGLKRHSHLVISVQLLVEAFFAVCFELNVVRGGEEGKREREKREQ